MLAEAPRPFRSRAMAELQGTVMSDLIRPRVENAWPPPPGCGDHAVGAARPDSATSPRMADLIRIWLETNHHAAFRSGGWGYVLAEGSALSGAAGGERTPSAERVALAGLVEALQAAPNGASVEVHSANPLVLAVPRRLAGQGAAGPPSEDLELWAQLTTALKARPARFASAANTPRTPTAFAAAWAELARDKAKTKPFHATIPRTNLATLKV